MFEGLNRLVDLQALATGRGTEAERAFRGMSILDVASDIPHQKCGITHRPAPSCSSLDAFLI